MAGRRTEGARARRLEEGGLARGVRLRRRGQAAPRPRGRPRGDERARAGTRGAKSRGLVAGGRSKPWRQKGTGRARAGTIRAPHWTGGGVAFPPVMRSFEVKVNRKARRAALRGALSDHAGAGTLAVLDGTSFEAPSTRRRSSCSTAEGPSHARRRDRGRGGARQVVPQHREGARDGAGRARGRVRRGRARCSSPRPRCRSSSGEQARAWRRRRNEPSSQPGPPRARRRRRAIAHHRPQVHVPRPRGRAQDAGPPGGRELFDGSRA